MKSRFRVLDLFSGAGGMSYGFVSHPNFKIVGAVDAQNGKPSSGSGTLECNKTYAANIGVQPLQADIGALTEDALREYLIHTSGSDRVDVLISCAPCTGYSRTIRKNLVLDDPRNSLVVKSASFVSSFKPSIFLMENVGELLLGKSNHHFHELERQLSALGYTVHAEVHGLDGFGLPQRRNRALVIATRKRLPMRTMRELWNGYAISDEAKTVRKAISHLRRLKAGERDQSDYCHVSPKFSDKSLVRLSMIPKDGGSWPDLLEHSNGWDYLIPSMERYARVGKVGPYRDIYGRLAWDEPAVTVKRECSHTGNGRYAHPDQDRLLSVREMGILQGFPSDYQFVASSTSNMYRHVGDAVPPLVSYQIAHLCHWIISGKKPLMKDLLLKNTHLKEEDILHIEDIGDFKLMAVN